jgi:hypothetical protein
MLLLTVLLGAFAGLVIWSFLKLVALCTGLVWETIPALAGGRTIIILLCALGGLAAGILRKIFGDYPESLDTVMGRIKKDHHYAYHPMFVMLVCWCGVRVAVLYITSPFFKAIELTHWLYPITWGLSTIAFIIYYVRSNIFDPNRYPAI